MPRLRQRLATATERTRFLRVAGVELALMVAIVSVTAVLVSEPPGRAEVAPKGRRPHRRSRPPRRRPSAAAEHDSNTDALTLGFGIAGLVTGLAALGLTLLRRPRRA